MFDPIGLGHLHSTVGEAYLTACRLVQEQEDLSRHFGLSLPRSGFARGIIEVMDRAAEMERLLNPFGHLERSCGLTAADTIRTAVLDAAASKQAIGPVSEYSVAASIGQDTHTAMMIAEATGNSLQWTYAHGPPPSLGAASATTDFLQSTASRMALGLSTWNDHFDVLSVTDRAIWSMTRSVAGTYLDTSIALAIDQAVSRRAGLEETLYGGRNLFQDRYSGLQGAVLLDSLRQPSRARLSRATAPTIPQEQGSETPSRLSYRDTDFIENCRAYEAMQIAGPAIEGVLRLEFNKLLSRSDHGENWVEQLFPHQRVADLKRIQVSWAKKGHSFPLYRCLSIGDIVSLVHQKATWRLVGELFSAQRKTVSIILQRISDARNLGAHAGCGLTEAEARRVLTDIRQLAIDLDNQYLVGRVDEITARLADELKPTIH